MTDHTCDIDPGNLRIQVIAGGIILVVLALVTLVGFRFFVRPTYQTPDLPAISELAQITLPADMRVTDSTLCYCLKRKMRAKMELNKSDMPKLITLLKNQGFRLSESDRISINEIAYPKPLPWWDPTACKRFISGHRKTSDFDTRIIVSMDDAYRPSVYLLWEEYR